MSNGFKVDNIATPIFGFQVGAGTLENTHDPAKCEGRPCVIHNPSDHHMRDWKLNWRADKYLMERICPCHGVGHPDLDDIAYHRSVGNEWKGIHGCVINDTTGLTCCTVR
jgi:hypothetical protein